MATAVTTKTFSTSILDRSSYAPDALNTDHPNGFVEYTLQFVNDADATDTFIDRVQADGTPLDLQNQIRLHLTAKFAPPPSDQVADGATFKFSVNGTVDLVP